MWLQPKNFRDPGDGIVAASKLKLLKTCKVNIHRNLPLSYIVTPVLASTSRGNLYGKLQFSESKENIIKIHDCAKC